MKNLSLPTADARTLKSPEASNKSNVVASNVDVAESQTSFQKMLNKQTQAKHVLAQENQVKQTQLKKTTVKEPQVKNADMAEVAKDNSQNSSHLQYVITATKHTKAMADKAAIDARQQVEKERTTLNSDILIDPNAQLNSSFDSRLKLTEETGDFAKQEVTLSNAPDVSLPVVNALAQTLPLVTTVANTSVEEHISSDVRAEMQRNLGAEIRDTALSHALQGKSTYLAEQDATRSELADEKQTQSNWLEAMLPNVAKAPAGDDAATKVMQNGIKESAIKATTISENAISANVQATPQIKMAEVSQQLASSNVINTYPGKTGWDQAISQKIVWMVGAQEQSATLTLNPPDMGPLQVVIHVHNDHADTTFISDNAEVRQALQDGMANLRDKLNESGIQLGQANVNSGGQMQQQFQQSAQKSATRTVAANNSQTSQTDNLSVTRPAVRVANGLVDTFV
ncbi:MAG: flagellar hook-length control protein FliK [Methylotenera sp.]